MVEETADRPLLGVGMVGYAFMGAAHSQAWRTAPHVFDLPLRPGMAVLCGRDAAAVRAAAGRLGWAATETDWRALIKRDDVHLVDVCTPGELHAEVAIAALEAGKHVLCEKPLANTEAEAEAMAAAAARAADRGVRSMTGFNYRRVPAVALARQLVADGRIGQVRHVRASYLQDWLVDPSFPLTWRLQRERAGSGALGDLGAHIVDLAQYLTGELIAGVSAATATFVARAPAAGGGRRSAALRAGDRRRRRGVHRPAALGRAGLVRGDQIRHRPQEPAADRAERGPRQPGVRPGKAERAGVLRPRRRQRRGRASARILVTEPGHPYLSAWWPPGHVLGWEHTFTHQVRDLVTAIATGTDPAPSFADGLQVQRVLAAVERSAAHESAWTPVLMS